MLYVVCESLCAFLARIPAHIRPQVSVTEAHRILEIHHSHTNTSEIPYRSPTLAALLRRGVSLLFLFMGILSLPSDHHSVFKLPSPQRTVRTLKDRKVDVSTDVDRVLCVVWVHLTGAFFLPCWSSQLRLPLQLHVSADYLPVFFCTGFLPVNRCLRCMSI